MAYNPYMHSGFADGFVQGFQLMSDAKERERRAAMEQKEFALREKEFGMREEEHGQNMLKLKQETDPEYQKARIRGLNAQAAMAEESTAASRETRAKVKEYETAKEKLYRIKKAQAVGGQVAKNLRDPEYLENGMAVGRVLETIKAGDISKVEPALFQKSMKWVAKTYEHEIKSGVGKEINAVTARQQGVPVGSKISDAELSNFYTSEDGQIVMELKVQVTAPDGSIHYYNAPVTKNRSSDPTDEVRMVSFEELERIGTAAQYIGSGVMDQLQAGRSLDDIATDLEASIARLGKDEKEDKLSKSAIVDKATEIYNKSQETAGRGKRGLSPEQSVAQVMKMVKATDGDISEEEVLEEVKKRTNNSGQWSVEVVPSRQVE